jgi:hypothetical protein
MLAVAPTPIGTGPQYRPPAGIHATCTGSPLGAGNRVHLELFARGRVVIVPAAVGVRGARLRFGRVEAARCRARVWTLDPSGVVRFTDRATLGTFFRVWGKRFGPHSLLSFRGAVRLYVNGVRRHRDPRALALRADDEIVVEVGPYIPPHRAYRFPRH